MGANRKELILIVDDVEINRIILREILQNDYDISEAALKYIKLWAKKVGGFAYEPILLHFMSKFSLADVVVGINEGLSENKLDEGAKKILYETFSKAE